MRILHIGDYHFKPKSNLYEQNLMVTKMIASLKTKEPIDLILFTGDLVNSGSNYSHFQEAHKSLISKLTNDLSISQANVFVAAGNHDIRREDAVKAIINYYDEKICKSDLLNEELTKNTDEFKLSLKPSGNFIKYLHEYYDDNYSEIDNLFTIGHKVIEGKKIALVSLNSAWLSCGQRGDVNQLMMPSLILKNAIIKIKNADCKILMIHHPLSYFKEFNGIELEDLIHKEFDLIFSGHIHREQMCARYSGHNGIFANTTQATLTFDQDGEIGYSLINYDLNGTGEIIVERATYLRKENEFIELKPVHVHVPFGEEKAQQNKLRTKITSKFPVELNTANELLLDYTDETSANFLELFTDPVLSTTTGTETTNSEKHGLFQFSKLTETDDNYLIFGKDKSGKTSILKKLQLFFLKNYSILSKVPFYIDYKDLETKGASINIRKLIRSYYEITNNDVEKLISDGRLIVLIDNLNTSSPVNKTVIDFLSENRNLQFISCSEYIATRVYFEELDHLEYSKIFLKDLTRKEIRLFSQKSRAMKDYGKDDMLDKISKTLVQLQLPVNYWTISLLLLIYKKSNDDYNKNLFGILDLCVDEILQKKQLSISKTKLSFEQYKEICSRIAYFLLKNYKANVYSASATELINFIDDLTKSNIRLGGDAKDIFDYLLAVGLLREKNSKYTFRLNGLFEYFLAYYINQHPDFKDELLLDDNIFLTFGNELEIYSGLNRKDDAFLRKIFAKIKGIFDSIIDESKFNNSFDLALMHKLDKLQALAEKIKKLEIKKAFDHAAQDEAKDDLDPLGTVSEVHLKEEIDANKITPVILEKYLTILSRVFKNSDSIANLHLENEIFDYILECYIGFGFNLIKNYTNPKPKEGEETKAGEEEDIYLGKEILRMLTTFIPIISQVMLYDGLGHPNLANLIVQHIEKLKPDSKENQYKLFLLYFLLIDIDVKGKKNYIEEVFEVVTLSPLKVSTFFKLNFYLGFKAYQDKDLENFFKIKVREAQIRMDDKVEEKENINKNLSNQQKSNLLRNKKTL